MEVILSLVPNEPLDLAKALQESREYLQTLPKKYWFKFLTKEQANLERRFAKQLVRNLERRNA